MKRTVIFPLLLAACQEVPCVEEGFVSRCEGEAQLLCVEAVEVRQECAAGCAQDLGFCNVCGDGILASNERCDDGDQIDTDGCRNDCTLGPSVCGDAIVGEGEDCDDGNFIADDGCEANCTHCGDGVIDASEVCDDGNIVGGDGCQGGCDALEQCGDGVNNPGDVCYAQSQELLVGVPNSVTLGLIAVLDLNSDGGADIALSTNNTLRTFLNNQDGTFTEQPQIVVTASPFAMLAADFNHDQAQDLLIPGNFSLNVFLGDGAGGFQQQLVSPIPDFRTANFMADFTGDGELDLVTSNGAKLRVVAGNGDGTFRSLGAFGVDIELSDAAFGDLNNDGNQDLVTNEFVNVFPPPPPSEPTIGHVFLGNGDGSFQQQQNIELIQFAELAVADFNNDGNLDLFDGHMQLGNGDGSFTSLGPPLPGGPGGELVADFNQDGNLDLASRSGLREINIFFGDGAGAFQQQGVVDLGAATTIPQQLIAATFNNDGLPDLVTLSFSGDLRLTRSNP